MGPRRPPPPRAARPRPPFPWGGGGGFAENRRGGGGSSRRGGGRRATGRGVYGEFGGGGGGAEAPFTVKMSPLFGEKSAPDTFNFLRHVMRAIWSVRPKCSHRCVSLKETLLKPVLILKHTTFYSVEQTAMRTKRFKHIAIQTVQEHLLTSWGYPKNRMRCFF